MKLYNWKTPNGLRVSVFLAEKGIDLQEVPVDVLNGENRLPPFLKINSLAQVPALELENGEVVTETIAICRYLEALNPEPSLFGRDPLEQARIEMWNRRIELNLFNTIGNVGLHEFEFFKDRVEQIPAFAASQRRAFTERLRWLNEEMANGREYVSGHGFSVADITGMAMLMICTFAQVDVPDEFAHVKRWEAALRARASWPL